jgi:hypothetical protein
MESRLFLLLAVIACCGIGGCATLHDYSTQMTNRSRAKQAFHDCVGSQPTDVHFRDGWLAGYQDVAHGSGGKARPFAPPKYFSGKYQNPEGEACLDNWMQGYEAGKQYALQSQADSYHLIPTLNGASLPRTAFEVPDWYFANIQNVEQSSTAPARDTKESPEPREPIDLESKEKSKETELPKPKASDAPSDDQNSNQRTFDSGFDGPVPIESIPPQRNPNLAPSAFPAAAVPSASVPTAVTSPSLDTQAYQSQFASLRIAPVDHPVFPASANVQLDKGGSQYSQRGVIAVKVIQPKPNQPRSSRRTAR